MVLKYLKKFWDWFYWGKGGSPYASFERRMMASLIDTLLLAVSVTPLLQKFVTVARPAQRIIHEYMWQYQQGVLSAEEFNTRLVHYMFEEGGAMLIFSDMGYQLFFVGVVIMLFWWARSATPGKMLLNMEIVDAKTGKPPTSLQCVIRYAGYVVAVTPLMLGFLCILWNKKRQGWHDKLAGTVVILKSHRNKQ